MARQVEQWWQEGVPGPEIKRRLGWSETSQVTVLIHRLREEGYDLPYRYPGVRRRNEAKAA